MLTPADKVKRGNDIIQIVITRKCNEWSCSNCTQLLPFRKDPVEMSLDCIEQALLSVRDWPGVVACFGGNPCNHSKFEQVLELWLKYVPEQNRRGLWSNNLMGHGPIIKQTFYPHGRFNLNVHGDLDSAQYMQKWLPGVKVWGTRPSRHGGVLGCHKDYGYGDAEWTSLRERCDINRNWSAGVYERQGKPYAYFCEVAGSIDGITGENNGIPAVPGWWREKISTYQHQVANCCDRHCIVPLRTEGHFDSDSTYDITPSVERLTLGLKGRNVKVQVRSEQQAGTHELTDYVGLRK